MRQFIITSVACLVLAGCGDPLRNVPRLGDLDVAERASQADVAAGPEVESIADAPAPDLSEAEQPRRGLLGFLRGRADAAKQEDPVAEAAADAIADSEDTAPEGEVQVAAAPPPRAEEGGRRGLFGGLFAGGGGGGGTSARAPQPGDPDYRQVGPGETLPYGEIARLCGAPINRLGREVAKYPERGRGYTIYDSASGSTGPRNFYITGFDDGCARQFTAALVTFGRVDTYEQIRYGAPSNTQPVSETDAAYEQVKSRVCRVGRGKPCGARINQLAQDTVFVSIYERFGSNPRWKNLLLHDGAVMALDIKSR